MGACTVHIMAFAMPPAASGLGCRRKQIPPLKLAPMMPAQRCSSMMAKDVRNALLPEWHIMAWRAAKNRNQDAESTTITNICAVALPQARESNSPAANA